METINYKVAMKTKCVTLHKAVRIEPAQCKHNLNLLKFKNSIYLYFKIVNTIFCL